MKPPDKRFNSRFEYYLMRMSGLNSQMVRTCGCLDVLTFGRRRNNNVAI